MFATPTTSPPDASAHSGLGGGQLDAHERGHGSRAHGHGLLHELAALAHEPDRVAKGQGAREHERRVLAEAVARGEVGRDAVLGEHRGGGHAWPSARRAGYWR